MGCANRINQLNGSVISGTRAPFGVPAQIADMSLVSARLTYWDKHRPEALTAGASG